MSIAEIMNKDETGEVLVKFADSTAERLVRDLKNTQIRNIFTEARQIEAMWEKGAESRKDAIRRLNLLKPKLAYQAKRHSSVEPLRKILSEAIDEVCKNQDEAIRDKKFQRFMELFEAILAYHRAKGGN